MASPSRGTPYIISMSYHTYFVAMADYSLESLKIFGYWKLNRDCETLHGRTPGSVKRVIRQMMPGQLKRPVRPILNAMKGS